DAGKTVWRCEGRTRIDDGHIEARKCRHRSEALADMHGAYDDEARRRQAHIDEPVLAIGPDLAGTAAAKGLFQRQAKLPGDRIARAHRTIPPVRELNDMRDRAAGANFLAEYFKNMRIHQPRRSI